MEYISNNFFVITGGPGAGKTTLLNALFSLGYKTVAETAREIIRREMETCGEGLPWKNRELYTRLMLEGSVKGYLDAYRSNNGCVTFFDRGIPDTFCYAGMVGTGIPGETESGALQYRYNRNVFILPPWKEIYETDNERKQDWDEAVITYEKMKETYEKYGYTVIEVPLGNVEARASFVAGSI